MQLARIFILIILVLGSTSVATAAEIIVPNGVTLLTEEQLLDRVIGNTFIGGKRWVEYYEPGIDGVKQGMVKGYSKIDGLHGGHGQLAAH